MKSLRKHVTQITQSLFRKNVGYGNLNPTPRYKRLLRLSAIIVGVLLLTYLLIIRSTPGGMFYGLKVNGIEEIGKYLHLSGAAKASYRITLLERRLAEIEQISAKQRVLSEEARTVLDTQIVESVEEFILIIETHEHITPRERVTLLYHLTTTLYLQDTLISRFDQLESLEDVAEARSDNADDIYEGTVRLFVASADGLTIQSYINEELQLLLRQIDTKDTDTETRLKVNRRLQDIQEAITNDNAVIAIFKVHEALQLLYVARYFK